MSTNEKDIYTLIQNRQSDRKYDPEQEIDRTVLERIVHAGCLSPSACNAQPWHFIIVQEKEKRTNLAKLLTSPLIPAMNRFAQNATAFIVVVKEPVNISSKAGTLVKGTDFSSYDIGIATGFICLAAEHEGLGSCIIGWLDKKGIAKLLNIPEKKDIPLVIALGKSLANKRDKSRKKTNETRSWESYK